MLATTGARELLRIAVAEREKAAELEANAARAAVRAKQLIDDAEQTFAALAGVDDEINAHHAEAIKAWATDGGERPGGDVPHHLISKKALKSDAESRLAAATQAHEVLRKELVAASERHENKKVGVQRAAAAVLSEEAVPLIGRLLAARRTLWALEEKLKSLSAVRYTDWDGRQVLIQMPPETFAALHETAPAPVAGNVPKPYAIALAKWEAYLQALTQDPDSSLD